MRRSTIVAAAVLALVATVAATVFAAGVAVPATSAGKTNGPADAQALAPADCGSLSLTAVVTGNGSGAAELVVGSSGDDTIDGGGGADCIVGGAGDDTIDGHGASVCIGGPGADVFTGCATEIQ
jgi:Ca2+-binding RTX toxin-like protein